mgnify:CR=1 FL=1
MKGTHPSSPPRIDKSAPASTSRRLVLEVRPGYAGHGEQAADDRLNRSLVDDAMRYERGAGEFENGAED